MQSNHIMESKYLQIWMEHESKLQPYTSLGCVSVKTAIGQLPGICHNSLWQQAIGTEDSGDESGIFFPHGRQKSVSMRVAEEVLLQWTFSGVLKDVKILFHKLSYLA